MIKYLLLMLPILFLSSNVMAQGYGGYLNFGSICQNGYIQCERSNKNTFRSDKRFCQSDVFEGDEILKENCMDKAFYDWQRRTIMCESRFRQCWWVYESDDDNYYPFPMMR